jgi:hypothetical protein
VFQTAIVLGQNMLAPFVVLVVVFGYLIQPKVRAVFLSSAARTPEEQGATDREM